VSTFDRSFNREFHGQMIPWIYLLTAHILVFTGVSTGTGMNDAAQEFKSIPCSNKCLHANTETSYRTPKKNLKVMPMAVFSKDFVSSLKHMGKWIY